MRIPVLCLIVFSFLSVRSYADQISYDSWKKIRLNVFSELDANADGLWTHEEYMNSIDTVFQAENLNKERIQPIKEVAKIMFSSLDSDKNGSISAEEFSYRYLYNESLEVEP